VLTWLRTPRRVSARPTDEAHPRPTSRTCVAVSTFGRDGASRPPQRNQRRGAETLGAAEPAYVLKAQRSGCGQSWKRRELTVTAQQRSPRRGRPSETSGRNLNDVSASLSQPLCESHSFGNAHRCVAACTCIGSIRWPKQRQSWSLAQGLQRESSSTVLSMS
jgi:hypothetical protein